MGQKISETLCPQTKQTFKDYWSGDIAKGVVNSEDGIFTSNFWTGRTTVFRSGGKKILSERRKSHNDCSAKWKTNWICSCKIFF